MSHFKNEMYDTIIHVDELSEKSCQKADACQILKHYLLRQKSIGQCHT